MFNNCISDILQANKTAPIVCKLLNQEMSSDLRKQVGSLVLKKKHIFIRGSKSYCSLT